MARLPPFLKEFYKSYHQVLAFTLTILSISLQHSSVVENGWHVHVRHDNVDLSGPYKYHDGHVHGLVVQQLDGHVGHYTDGNGFDGYDILHLNRHAPLLFILDSYVDGSIRWHVHIPHRSRHHLPGIAGSPRQFLRNLGHG